MTVGGWNVHHEIQGRGGKADVKGQESGEQYLRLE